MATMSAANLLRSINKSIGVGVGPKQAKRALCSILAGLLGLKALIS